MTDNENTINFPNGTGKVPAIAFGTWTVFGQRGTEEQVEEAVKVAIDTGYRHIDTAWIYGTERCVGRAIAKKIDEGVITRKDIFVTTKLWDGHHNPNMVKKALQYSLQELQLSYVDLYLIHWPGALKDIDVADSPQPEDGSVQLDFDDHSIEDVYKALEECQKAGLTKYLGLSNFNRAQVMRIMNTCSIKPVCNQIEVGPYFDNNRLIHLCKEQGIVVAAYAPLGAPTRPWKEPGETNPLEESIVKDIAEKKGKQPAQIYFRYHLQNGLVVVTKSVTPARVRQNIEIFDFELNESEMKRIASLNRNIRAYQRVSILKHPEYPFHEPI